jgi:dGTPase
MDFADDVAYSVHDLEDGIVAGGIDLGLLDDPDERAAVWQTVRDWYLPDVEDAALDAALAELRGIGSWPSTSYDGSRPALARLKNLTSDLIGVFCGGVQAATRAVHGGRPLVRHTADLVVPPETVRQVHVLKGVAAHYVMRSEERRVLMVREQELLAELFEVLQTHPEHLDATFAADHAAARNDDERTRVVVDQIASLTDASAVTWHARLRGGTS